MARTYCRKQRLMFSCGAACGVRASEGEGDRQGVVCLPGVLRGSNVANEDVAVSNMCIGDVMHNRAEESAS